MKTSRNIGIVVAALALALGTLTCSKAPAPPAKKDAGQTSVECQSGDECAAGDCIDGTCVWCSELTCPVGTLCSHNGKCLGCDGGCDTSSADAAVPLDAGTSCSSRAQCTGLACLEGLCADENPDGGCVTGDECNAGNACTSGFCVAGCSTNADCVGAAAGPRCDTSTDRCGPCATADDCAPASENCLGGKCVKAAACPGGDRTPCVDLACIAELCRPCAAGTDCGVGFDCKNGNCVARAGCTDTSQCLTLSPGHWCDVPSGLCKWGCLAGTGCANCCPTKQACNTTSHQCEKVPCNNCGGTCILPQICDDPTCGCVTPPTCDSSCGCANGKTCDCSSSGLPTCVSYLCALPNSYVCK